MRHDYKHTPGPWEVVDGDTRDDKVYWVTIGGDGKIIGEAFGHAWGEVTKNAELMAAAPELLSLALRCLSVLEGQDMNPELQVDLRVVINRVEEDKREK